MTGGPGRPRWSDATAAAGALRRRPGDRRTLLLLASLPLLPERAIERLAGLRSGARAYGGLRRLAGTGLVGAVYPAGLPGHGARLFHLTDLGLAAVALDQHVALEPLARRQRLRRADLLGRLPGLPHLLAGYELLAALAACRPGRPDLLAWERPWRRRYRRATAKHPVAAALPAYAALAWDPPTGEAEGAEGAGAYLLLPDLATFPLRQYRPALDHLLALRALGAPDGGPFPTLVVATRDAARAAAWEALLEEARRGRAEAPLAACVAVWGALPAGLEPLRGGADPPRSPSSLVRRVRLPRGTPAHPDRPLPRLVGAPLGAPAASVPPGGAPAAPGAVALGLSATDRALLDLVGRHPFLTAGRLAAFAGRPPAATRQRLDRLVAVGLLRRVGPQEAPAVPGVHGLAELTLAGLRLVAAQQGLTLGAAVRANGLAGGGPDTPVGARRTLLWRLAHTVGADGVFVGLAAGARRGAAGRDGALLEWRGAAACARGGVRPDGYGLYRHDGRLYGFFLEYDRGTMRAGEYRAKFAAYHEQWARGRFAPDRAE